MKSLVAVSFAGILFIAPACGGGGQSVMTPTSAPPPTVAGEAPLADKIAFSSNRDGNAEIYVMDPDGSNQERLTDDPEHDRNPTWSPDGTRIAFVRESGSYRMNSDGSGEKKLTSANPSHLAWSPDGTRIAFALGELDSSDIFVMSASGIGWKNLTNSPDTADFEPT